MEDKKIMTDDLKIKAGKAVDDARVATHTILKDAGAEAQKVSEKVQTVASKAVADAKIAAHEAGSRLKKR